MKFNLTVTVTLCLIVGVFGGQDASPENSTVIKPASTAPNTPDDKHTTEVPIVTNANATDDVKNETTLAPTTLTTSQPTSSPTSKPTTTPVIPKSTTSVSPKPTIPVPTPNTTTPKPSSTSSVKPSSTVLPVTTAVPQPPNNRKFDGPSFVGGIVLACGLMAIGFVAFKFYKARTELNYHTL